MTTLVREALERGFALNMSKSMQEILVQRILDKAIKQGDTGMIRVLWEHLDGRPNKKSTLLKDISEEDRTSIAELTECFRKMAEVNRKET